MPDTKEAGPTHEEIAKRAFELYLERSGNENTCEDGHATKDWLIAEKELRQDYARRQIEQAKSRLDRAKARAPKH